MRNTNKREPKPHPIAQHIREIVEAGSVHAPGTSFISPIRCIKRPMRKPCRGRIGITPMFDVILWQCTECEAGGNIFGWRQGGSDLSEFVPTPEQRRLVFGVSDQEYRALKEVAGFMAEEAAILASAVWADNEVVISGPFESIRFFTDTIATEFHRSTDRKKRKLLWDVCMRIDALAAEQT